MSRYQSSTAQLQPTAAETAAVHAIFASSPATLCSSGQLHALSAELAAPAAVAARRSEVLASVGRLLADERLGLLATTAGTGLAARLESSRRQLDRAPATLAGPSTASLLADLVPYLAREERTVVAACAVDTLGAQGYSVIHESGPNADGIEARRGHEVMLLAVTDGGELSVDHVGVDGACADRQARFETGMAERGVVLRTRATTAHGDHDGPLVAAAAAARETSLARAVARHAAARGGAQAPRSRARTRTADGQLLAGGAT